MQRLLSLAALLALSCAASAQTTLDVTVPGNTVCSYTTGPVTTGATPGHLQATATGMSGTGCGSTNSGSGGVSFGPASPLSAPSPSGTISNTGGTATFTFQPINASACTGTITPSTGTSFTGFCNSASACAGAQSVTAQFPANSSTTTDVNYTVSVSCTGPNSPTPVTSAPARTVTVSHSSVVTSTCPSITSTSTGIAAFQRWTGNVPVAFTSKGTHSVSITDFPSFFLSTKWPGSQSGLIGQVIVPNDKYVSLQFAVPAGYLASQPDTVVGQYSVGETAYSVPISMTISTTCGDFSNPATYPSTSTVVPGCYKNLAPHSGGIVWRKTGSSCVLQDGKTYYFNFINADVSNVQPGGKGTATSNRTASACPNGCSDPIDNGPGSWATD